MIFLAPRKHLVVIRRITSSPTPRQIMITPHLSRATLSNLAVKYGDKKVSIQQVFDLNKVSNNDSKPQEGSIFDNTKSLKDYFCRLVDDTPKLAKDFAIKFENMKEAKRAYYQALEDFDKVHRSFFFHAGADYADKPLFWE